MAGLTGLILLLSTLTCWSINHPPNILIIQPDDLPHYHPWHDPPKLGPDSPRADFPLSGMPNIERLRSDGIEMTQAYTTSPACGTSRFSTITSRFPSRAISNSGERLNNVAIHFTKLEGRDCSDDNLPQQFRRNGYRTAHIGKWHLSSLDYTQYTYDYAVNVVKNCGFDLVGGLYPDNLGEGGRYNANGTFGHNLEWITSEAIKVIQQESDEPFFMYYNPTVPHRAFSVKSSLTELSCRDTPSGRLSYQAIIPGLTDTMNCSEYRATVMERAGDDPTEADLGAIWLDDMVGALLRTLEDGNQLDNTIIVFFEDHGINPKMTLYEGGIRVPMFWHYGDHISRGSKFDVPVQVIDIGPTLLDYAEIVPSYEMDGLSLKDSLNNVNETGVDLDLQERCLFYENGFDRAVRCGCRKFLQIKNTEGGNQTGGGNRPGGGGGNRPGGGGGNRPGGGGGNRPGGGGGNRPGGGGGNRPGGRGSVNISLSYDHENLFDLCDGTNSYSTDVNTEVENMAHQYAQLTNRLQELISCHLDRVESKDYSAICQTGGGNGGGGGGRGGFGGGGYGGGGGECHAEKNCPTFPEGNQYGGSALCMNATKPHRAPLRGSVGCVDQDALAIRPTVASRHGNGRNRPANNIYGMMEAGFTNKNPKWGCLGDQVIDGGFDTKTAEHIGQVLCPNEAISVLDFCGGHAFPYHYHERMSCLFSEVAEGPTKGHSTRVGTALDGNGIYGHHIAGGVIPTDLDACGGRVGITPDSDGATVYYYVITDQPPFTLGCFGSVESYPVSVAECRELYPDTCTEEKKTCVTTMFGSGLYSKDCPCYDPMTASNVLLPMGIPGYIKGGKTMGEDCVENVENEYISVQNACAVLGENLFSITIAVMVGLFLGIA